VKGGEGAKIVITHLAHGVPISGELDYFDDGTLMAAVKARRAILPDITGHITGILHPVRAPQK
jgi:hypothetical protein